MELFQGNEKAHYTFDPDRTPEPYLAIHRGIELADIERHLRGEVPSLLDIPIDEAGLSHFGVLDVDRHEDADESVDHVALAKRVTELSLPLVVCKSKSPKGAHLFLFLKEKQGFDAATTQRLLKH